MHFSVSFSGQLCSTFKFFKFQDVQMLQYRFGFSSPIILFFIVISLFDSFSALYLPFLFQFSLASMFHILECNSEPKMILPQSSAGIFKPCKFYSHFKIEIVF